MSEMRKEMVCPMTVAHAAPAMPHFAPKMKAGSRAIFAIAPASIEAIDQAGLPSARMTAFIIFESMNTGKKARNGRLQGIKDGEENKAREERDRDPGADRAVGARSVLLPLTNVEECRTPVAIAPCKRLCDDEDGEYDPRRRIAEGGELAVADEDLIDDIIERSDEQGEDAGNGEFEHEPRKLPLSQKTVVLCLLHKGLLIFAAKKHMQPHVLCIKKHMSAVYRNQIYAPRAPHVSFAFDEIILSLYAFFSKKSTHFWVKFTAYHSETW